jgi:hypothetical protein
VVIQAVTFDIWETLLFERDGNDRRRLQIRSAKVMQTLKTFGVHLTISQIQDGFTAMHQWFFSIWEANDSSLRILVVVQFEQLLVQAVGRETQKGRHDARIVSRPLASS